MVLKNEKAQEKYELLLKEGNILAEFIVGSQAYGTNTPTSDIDKVFVYIEPLDNLLSDNMSEKIELTKDYNGYEIGRFMELLGSANPNILDLVSAPEDCILSMNPLYKKHIVDNVNLFLTKQVRYSFAQYAAKQIKKARGENKKIMQPMEKERKGMLDFCWVVKKDTSFKGWLKRLFGLNQTQGTQSLRDWLKEKKIDAENCGVAALDHMKNCYLLYTQWCKGFKGIIDKDDVQIVLSSVPKGELPDIMFYANVEGFSKYCKDYKEYWDWVENRNEDRYQENIDNGAAYDGKNMAHCHRLLDMAIEILKYGILRIRRPNREQLLAIRYGKYEYEKLISDANAKIEEIEKLYEVTELPEKASSEVIQNILLNIRKEFYEL